MFWCGIRDRQSESLQVRICQTLLNLSSATDTKVAMGTMQMTLFNGASDSITRMVLEDMAVCVYRERGRTGGFNILCTVNVL